MPIDASIYSQSQPQRFNTPFDVLGQIGQLQQQRQAIQSNQALEQERRAKLAEDAKKQAEADTFNRIIGNPALTRETMLSTIKTQAPEHYLSAMKSFEDLDKSAAEYEKTRAEAQDYAARAQKAQQDVIGTVANSIASHNYAPAAFEVGLKELETRFPEFAPTAQNYRQLALQNGPQWIKEHVDGLRSMADRSTEAKMPGEQAVSQREQLVTAGTNTQGITAQQQTQNAAAQVTGAAATRNAATNAAREAREQKAASLGDTLLGGGTGPSAQLPQGQRNDDYLASLPTALADKAKALVEGRLQLPTRFTKGDTYWQSILDAATKYDPSFDAGNYNARAKARMDLTNPKGAGGAVVNSLNTAIQHAGTLSDLIETEGNTNSPIANAVINPVRSAVGSTKVTNFNAVQPQLMKEIERLWRGTGGSTADVDALKNSLGPNMGIQQQREALSSFVDLMRGKLSSTETQRDNILGVAAGKDIPILFEASKPVLDKIEKRAKGDKAKAGTIRARDPQGNLHEAPAGTPLPVGWKAES